MWLDIPAKYLIVWVVGNSLHEAHRVRGLANRPSAHQLPIHPQLFSTFEHLNIAQCSIVARLLSIGPPATPAQIRPIFFCFYQ